MEYWLYVRVIGWRSNNVVVVYLGSPTIAIVVIPYLDTSTDIVVSLETPVLAWEG